MSFQFRSRLYPLQGYGQGYRLRGSRITVCEACDGTVTLIDQGQVLDYTLLQEGEAPIPMDDEKSPHPTVEQAKLRQAQQPPWKPAPDHPWRRSYSSTTASHDLCQGEPLLCSKGDIPELG